MLDKNLALVCLFLLLVGCGTKDLPANRDTAASEVLVTVNGNPITQADLDVTTEKVLSGGVASLYAQDIQQKALESMVMMMAIAQESENKATDEELQTIYSKTRRYQEELLTELYMRNFTDVAPPTEAQVAEYYTNNKILFGEETIKYFEIVRTVNKPKGETLQSQLQQLSQLSADQWLSVKAKLAAQKGVFEVVSSASDVANLDKSLLRVVSGLNENEVSKLVYLDEKPHVIKVVKTRLKDAAPLSQVRTRIRKTLAAQKLKQQLKEVSAEIMAGADIQYTDENK